MKSNKIQATEVDQDYKFDQLQSKKSYPKMYIPIHFWYCEGQSSKPHNIVFLLSRHRLHFPCQSYIMLQLKTLYTRTGNANKILRMSN